MKKLLFLFLFSLVFPFSSIIPADGPQVGESSDQSNQTYCETCGKYVSTNTSQAPRVDDAANTTNTTSNSGSDTVKQ